MGVAILSGVIASLQSRDGSYCVPKWESHTPGTVTPTAETSDPSLPSGFIATVTRPESQRRLQQTFSLLGGLGPSVQVVVGENLAATQKADVVILWYVPLLHFFSGGRCNIQSAASHTKPILSLGRMG